MEITQEYSPDIAEKILDKFHEKGWNLYHMNQFDSKKTIKNNLAEVLEIDNQYVLLPIADNPRDPEQVTDALKVLAQKLDGKMPTISVGDKSYLLIGFTLKKEQVKIHTPEGTFVPYSVFIESIDSVVKTK